MSLENLTPDEVAKLRNLLEGDGGKVSEATTTTSETEEVPKTQRPPRGPRKPWYRNRVILSALALVTVVALAFIYVFAVEPWLSLRAAQSELTQEAVKSSITVGNSEIVSYTPTTEDEVLAGANPKQIALGKDGVATPASYIEFKSDKAGPNSHGLDLYIDFYSQRSRDLISLNNLTLANYIASGKIILRVHPVLDKDGFSVFAPEALAEVAATNPNLAWDFFVSLMKNSDSVLSNPNTETAATPSSKEIVDFIAGVAKTTGVPTGSPDGVDADSIKYLSFFSWLYSGGKDEKLAVGYYPPVLYIDDKEINQDDWILTDPNSLLKLITSLD